MAIVRNATEEDLQRHFGGGAFFGVHVKPTLPEEEPRTTGDDVVADEPQGDEH